MKKRGQVSTEYLIVFAIAFMVIAAGSFSVLKLGSSGILSKQQCIITIPGIECVGFDKYYNDASACSENNCIRLYLKNTLDQKLLISYALFDEYTGDGTFDILLYPVAINPKEEGIVQIRLNDPETFFFRPKTKLKSDFTLGYSLTDDTEGIDITNLEEELFIDNMEGYLAGTLLPEFQDMDPPEGTESFCDDNKDNDYDGDIDCDDEDCVHDDVCEKDIVVEDCTTPEDEDGDGFGACDDPDCVDDLVCKEECVPVAEICDNTIDDDCDGLIDSLDGDCTSSIEICYDGIDNDGDNLIDCADPDCNGQFTVGLVVCEIPETTCNDNFDNDGDNLIDCDDICTYCGNEPNLEGARCILQYGEKRCMEKVCDNVNVNGIEIDDDRDGLANCQDDDCILTDICLPKQPEEICNNGVDDNGNWMVDCSDNDCYSKSCNYFGSASSATCPNTQCFEKNCCTEQNCADNLDNNNKDGADCADPDCNGKSCAQIGASTSAECGARGRCIEIVCNDHKDNDGDTCTDTIDADCGGTETLCTDDKDNDCDGLTDCFDPDCKILRGCAAIKESDCSDGNDNDGDGKVDCADTDCLNRYCAANGVYYSAHCVAGNPGYCEELYCQDGLDNNNLYGIDCNEPFCLGKKCGPGLFDTSICDENKVCIETGCGDGVDNDWDKKTDCFDPDCLNNEVCEFPKELTCNDNIDNDADGLTDCDDIDCSFYSPSCTKAGSNDIVMFKEVGDATNSNHWLNNPPNSMVKTATDACQKVHSKNCYGIELYFYTSSTVGWEWRDIAPWFKDKIYGGTTFDISCDIPFENYLPRFQYFLGKGDLLNNYKYRALCTPQPENSALACNDGIDNDGDGLNDCNDPNCNSISSCIPPVEICYDDKDNEGDGLIDCADIDCADSIFCKLDNGNFVVNIKQVGLTTDVNNWYHADMDLTGNDACGLVYSDKPNCVNLQMYMLSASPTNPTWNWYVFMIPSVNCNTKFSTMATISQNPSFKDLYDSHSLRAVCTT